MNPWDLVWTGTGWFCLVLGVIFLLVLLSRVLHLVVLKPAIAGLNWTRHEIRHYRTRHVLPAVGQVWRSNEGAYIRVQEVYQNLPLYDVNGGLVREFRVRVSGPWQQQVLTRDAWQTAVQRYRLALQSGLARRGRV